jgi:predicted MFS family arabinose efflux permease
MQLVDTPHPFFVEFNLQVSVILNRFHSILQKPNLNKNSTAVLIEAIFLGILFSSEPFLPVFLTRLGATTFQVGLLTSMPAVAGLLLTIPLGQYLINSRQIADWYRYPRLAGSVAYVFTGLIPFLVSAPQLSIMLILVVWAAATLPHVILMITFSVVMNAVAGPKGRYELMARRHAIVVLVSAASVAGAGWFLEQIAFPLNFQLLFMFFSILGGGAAFYFASHIKLPEKTSVYTPPVSIQKTMQDFRVILRENPSFTSFVWIRFVFMLGYMTVLPLIPVYYVREVQASDGWIGLISTVQLGVMVFGYFFWLRQTRGKLSNRTMLLATTLVLAVYPAIIACTHKVELIALVTGLAFFFQAGLDLVFFDELMRTVPEGESIRYISLAQSIQYIAAITGPLLGSFLSGHIGLSGALFVGAAIRGIGFLLFFFLPLDKEPIPAV